MDGPMPEKFRLYDFEYIRNILANSFSRLYTLGLYEANEPKKERHEHGKSTFDSATEWYVVKKTTKRLIKTLKLMVSNASFM